MKRNWPAAIFLCAVVLISVGIVLERVPYTSVELSTEDETVSELDKDLDSAILGAANAIQQHNSKASKLSVELDRKEPHIVTALDVMSQPHFERSVSQWARERQASELERAASPAPNSIVALELKQQMLQKKLDRMLSKKIHSTTSNVNRVLQQQARISKENLNQIQNDLVADRFDTKHVPEFHSKALDGPLHVREESSVLKQLQRELAAKIAANERLEQRANVRDPVNIVGASQMSDAHAVVFSTPKKSNKLAFKVDSAHSANDATSQRSLSWANSVPYDGIEGNGLPAARNVLQTSKDRVVARLDAQLRNAKRRFERFRSHWSVHMPDELRRATKEGWTSQYSKDYMNEGKTRYDIATEERMVDMLKDDLDSTTSEEDETSQKLQQLKHKEYALTTKVNDLNQHMQEDQRDLSLAEDNLTELKRHLPEHYDDLSDGDYKSYFRHAHP